MGYSVKATREGLVGEKTASGFVIDEIVPFVALPHVNALGKFVHILNPLTNRSAYAIVLDVGPWNTHDNYWTNNQRPQAESGISVSGQGTNGAGIDLGEKVWKELGMQDNTTVEWEFLL